MYKFESQQTTNIDEKIIEERNEEIKNIEQEIMDISEIMHDISLLVDSQGESIETAVQNIEHTEENVVETVTILEKAEMYQNKNTKMIRNAVLIVGGISLGSLGFIGGPIIGAVTVLMGTITGTGIAFTL